MVGNEPPAFLGVQSAMIKIRSLIVFLGLCITAPLHAQHHVALLSAQYVPDTVYYPYYNDVQMIEIDYLPAWEQECMAIQWRHMYMSQAPRMPDPPVNTYLFRNREGEIVKAFNTTEGLQELTNVFRAHPENRKSDHIRFAPSHIAPRKHFSSAIYDNSIGAEKSSEDFRGYYMICNDSALQFGAAPRFFDYNRTPAGAYVGMIDSFGNVFLEMKYKALIALNDYILVAGDTRCGVINKRQQTIVPFVYTSYKLLNENEVIFLNDQKIGAICTITTGAVKYIDNFDFIDFEQRRRLCLYLSEKPDSWLIRFRKDGKTGLLDTNYNIVTPAVYDMIAEQCAEERVVCCRDRRFGYLDLNGHEVIPCVFTYAEYFRKGVGVVQYDGTFQNVDRTGKIVAVKIADHEPWRNDVYSFHHDVGSLRMVRTISGCGLAKGKDDVFVVPPIYENIEPVRTQHYGMHIPSSVVFIAKQHGKVGVLDTSGRIVLPIIYESIRGVTDANGFRVVQMDYNHYGMINSRYEVVIPCVYELIQCGYGNEEFFRVWKDHKCGTMDTTGKFIIPPLYSQLNLFVNGRARAKKDSLYGFIDDRGNVLIPFEFEEVYGEFNHGLAGFRRDGKWGFIDTTGAIIIPAQYDEVRRFSSSITGVKLNGKWGFISRNGKLVVDYVYENVGYEWHADGTTEVQLKGKIGYVNERGKVVIPIEYTKSWGFSNELGHYLEKDGMKRYVER